MLHDFIAQGARTERNNAMQQSYSRLAPVRDNEVIAEGIISQHVLTHSPAIGWTPFNCWSEGARRPLLASWTLSSLPCVHRLYIAFGDTTVSATALRTLRRTTNHIPPSLPLRARGDPDCGWSSVCDGRRWTSGMAVTTLGCSPSQPDWDRPDLRCCASNSAERAIEGFAKVARHGAGQVRDLNGHSEIEQDIAVPINRGELKSE